MDKRKIMQIILWGLAIILAIMTIILFIYPLVKSFMIYQSGVQEQEAFNSLVVPLILKNWIYSLLTGVCCTIMLKLCFGFLDNGVISKSDMSENKEN